MRLMTIFTLKLRKKSPRALFLHKLLWSEFPEIPFLIALEKRRSFVWFFSLQHIYFRNVSYSLSSTYSMRSQHGWSIPNEFLEMDNLRCDGTEDDVLFCQSNQWQVHGYCNSYVPWIENCRKFLALDCARLKEWIGRAIRSFALCVHLCQKMFLKSTRISVFSSPTVDV